MANRYFRNVNQGYNTTTSWSATDNGPSVGAIPTTADDVFFTANSGNCTGVGAGATSKSLNFTGYTNTLTFTTAGIGTLGNVTLSPTMTIVPGISSAFTIIGNCIFTSNGKYVPVTIYINATVTVTLADTLNTDRINISASPTLAGSFGFNAGTLDITAPGAIATFTVGNVYKIGSITNTVSNSGNKATIWSSIFGVPVTLYATGVCNIGYTDFTDIDASLGRPLYTFGGVVTNCLNVNTFLEYIPPVNTTTSAIISI